MISLWSQGGEFNAHTIHTHKRPLLNLLKNDAFRSTRRLMTDENYRRIRYIHGAHTQTHTQREKMSQANHHAVSHNRRMRMLKFSLVTSRVPNFVVVCALLS